MIFTISLGSNLSKQEAEKKIRFAISYLQGFLDEGLRCSSIYETAGVGSGEGKTYFNAVAKGESIFPADVIVSVLKDLEKEMGRTPETKRRGVVPIDLDLLQLGETVYKPKDLSQDYVQIGLKSLLD